MSSQKVSKIDEFLFNLAQLESIKEELNKNSDPKNSVKLIEQANETISEFKKNLCSIHYRIPTSEYKRFEKKLNELVDFIKNYAIKAKEPASKVTQTQGKFNYDEQPLIDSFNMDGSWADKENQIKAKTYFESQSTVTRSQIRSLQVNKNLNNIMSQSIINFDKSILKEPRSKSLCQSKIPPKRINNKKSKIFKEPVVVVSANKRNSTQPRSSSISNFTRKLKDDDATQNEIIYETQNQTQMFIPDTQLYEPPVKNTSDNNQHRLIINLIKDEELIPLNTFPKNYWENISNGKINIKREFQKFFDF